MFRAIYIERRAHLNEIPKQIVPVMPVLVVGETVSRQKKYRNCFCPECLDIVFNCPDK